MTTTKWFSYTPAARVLALALLFLVSVIVIGCGGGGIDPVAPQPLPSPPPSSHPLQWFSGVFIDSYPDGSPGGKPVDAINLPKGRETFVWFRALSLPGEYDRDDPTAPWTVVTTEYVPKLTIAGSPSGSYMPNPGLKRVQCVLNAGAQYKVVWEPPEDSAEGSVHYYIEITELNIKEDIWVAVIPADGELPPIQQCTQSPEVRDGYWWACISDGAGGMIFGNTGVPAENPPPPTDGFYAYGSFGYIYPKDTIHIEKGTAKAVQFFVGNELINSNEVTVELPLSLPDWLWLPATSEISTVRTVGNPIYVPVGEYDLSFWYKSMELELHLVVDPNRELPRLIQNYLFQPDAW